MAASTQRRRPSRTTASTEAEQTHATPAAAHFMPGLGNQDLLELTEVGPEASPVATLGPWLEGEAFQTSDFLAGLNEQGPGIQSAGMLVHSFNAF